MSREQQIYPVAPTLPTRIDSWTRYVEKERSLNDLVEDVHRILWDESPEYRNYLQATYDAHAVEGSLAMDNAKAAEMLRDKAAEIDPGHEVAKQKLAVINMALGVVLRRYHASRKQRRLTVGGQEVPSGDDE